MTTMQEKWRIHIIILLLEVVGITEEVAKLDEFTLVTTVHAPPCQACSADGCVGMMVLNWFRSETACPAVL